MTTPIDLDDLEAKAKAATRGPWVNYSTDSVGVSCGDGSYEPIFRAVRSVRGKNAEFIESCSPDVILALIAEVRALRAEAEAHAWKISPAMAQVALDAANARADRAGGLPIPRASAGARASTGARSSTGRDSFESAKLTTGEFNEP